MRRPARPWLLGAVAALVLVACRDLPAPTGNVLSLSQVLLPSPGVVVGDTMRDSLGVVSPLRVIAYGPDGLPIDPQPEFFFALLDTGAHLDGARLIGDRAGASIRIIGSAAGLQTQVATALVTLRPDTIVAADSARHVRRFPLLSTDSVINSADLTVLVRNRAGGTPTGVDAVIVEYALVRTLPAAPDKGPAIQIMNASRPSTRDTTAGGGRAARTARLRLAAFAGTLPDSAIVQATASHRGRSLGTVQFTIVFMNQ